MFLEEKIKCPACGAGISAKEVKCCPVCGLENLNRIFLSKEERMQWVDTVLKPHIASGKWDPSRELLLWGKYHMLGLSAGGCLYGIGDNKCRQIQMDAKQESFDNPVLICKNVRAAAASPHYSVFVTYDGELRMQGDEASDIARRYQKNPIKEEVRDVAANTAEDSFWAVTVSGKVYFWGRRYYNNELVNAGLLPEATDQIIYVFPEEIKYEKPVYVFDHYSKHSVLAYYTDAHIEDGKYKSECQGTPEYLSFCEEYGERNLRLEWSDSGSYKKMRVMRRNDVIYVPELMQGSAEDLKKCSLNVEALSEVSTQSAEKLKKYMETLEG